MQNNYQTNRLILKTLELNDAAFLTELVNTQEWLKFIGDRNIRTEENAKEYIQKIKDNPTITYWVVRLADVGISIGIITFIKRDYLDHYDIGFAFLSKFTNKGYAYEATTEVMNDVLNNPSHTHILATTVRENVASINLLEKLGLRFEKKIHHENDVLLIYAVSVDELFINQVTASFYSAFTNTNQQVPALENVYTICLPEATIIKKKRRHTKHLTCILLLNQEQKSVRMEH